MKQKVLFRFFLIGILISLLGTFSSCCKKEVKSEIVNQTFKIEQFVGTVWEGDTEGYYTEKDRDTEEVIYKKVEFKKRFTFVSKTELKTTFWKKYASGNIVPITSSVPFVFNGKVFQTKSLGDLHIKKATNDELVLIGYPERGKYADIYRLKRVML